jgi:hypothetical protein
MGWWECGLHGYLFSLRPAAAVEVESLSGREGRAAATAFLYGRSGEDKAWGRLDGGQRAVTWRRSSWWPDGLRLARVAVTCGRFHLTSSGGVRGVHTLPVGNASVFRTWLAVLRRSLPLYPTPISSSRAYVCTVWCLLPLFMLSMSSG